LAIPAENITPERIAMVLLISIPFILALIFNLPRFLRQHGYELGQIHIALEQMAENDKNFIYEFKRLAFLHLVPVAFTGTLIFYYGDLPAVIVEFSPFLP
jgi:hypothetical protein